MTERRHVALLPGGFEEASIVEPGRERVYVRRRKGFVKLALRYGYTIYPIYTFGESEAYRTFVPASTRRTAPLKSFQILSNPSKSFQFQLLAHVSMLLSLSSTNTRFLISKLILLFSPN